MLLFGFNNLKKLIWFCLLFLAREGEVVVVFFVGGSVVFLLLFFVFCVFLFSTLTCRTKSKCLTQTALK